MTLFYKYCKYILFWSCYILYAYLMETWRNPSTKFLDILFANLCSISAFYISLLSYKLIDRKKFLLSCSCFLLSLVCCWTLRYIYWHYLLTIIDLKPFAPYNFGSFTQIVVRVFVIYSLYALGYFFAQRSIQRQKQLRLAEQQQAEAEKEKFEMEKIKLEVEKENLKLEKEKLGLENKNLRLQDDLLQSENNFLRAQINPHFLYNCLNFFYSETMENNPTVSDGILILADIMRYSLKDYTATNGLANLSEEITHIENVITIHQLRFVGTLHIRFSVEGDPKNKLIAPMVLITMVENVFKHGNINDKNNPALMECKIDCANNTVHFTTENKKKTGTKELSTGIGLENIKQRLRSLYKENFSIITSETETYYKKEITIPYFDQHQPISITKIPKAAVC